jgi:hypothetical protein
MDHLLAWKMAYTGSSPNDGFCCTGDLDYDTFDMKLVLRDIGPGNGVLGLKLIRGSTNRLNPRSNRF